MRRIALALIALCLSACSHNPQPPPHTEKNPAFIVVLPGYQQPAQELVNSLKLSDKIGIFAPETPKEGWRPDSEKAVTQLAALIRHKVQQNNANPHKIFILGSSNGAQMAWRLACTRPQQFAGLIVNAGNYQPYQDCQSALPLPVLVFHNRDDVVMPYNGGVSSRHGATGFALARALQNRCAPQPKTRHTAKVDFINWVDCRYHATVMLVAGAAGGHVWPTHGTGFVQKLIATHQRD